MHEHLVILPHAGLLPPAVAQPGEFVHVPSADHLLGVQLSDQPVQVGAILIEVHTIPVGGTVVQCRQEIREGRQLFEKWLRLPLVNRLINESAERGALGVFLYQNAIEARIRAQWTDDAMRVAGQPVPAQNLEVLELPAHTLVGVNRTVGAALEEFADYLGATVALLVEIDFAVLHTEDAKFKIG